MAADTIPARLLSQGQSRPNQPAYFVRSGAGWQATTWKQYVEEVRVAARALMSLGFEVGEKTTILGFNRPEWTIFDLATMCAGGAPAGIYTTNSAEEVHYITDHTEARAILVENRDQLAKVQEVWDRLPHLDYAILMKGAEVESSDGDRVLSWEAFCARADDVPDADLDARVDALKLGETATLIYTSGTTGPPKGVMLSHENLAWTAGCALSLVSATDTDCSISYLPLSHIAEQMFSLHVPVTCGSRVYFAESIEKLPENLKEVQPSIFFGVPRIWEKFYAGIQAKASQTQGLKKKIGAWAKRVGAEVNDHRNRGRGEPGGVLGIKYKVANALVFSKVKPLVGLGNARICVSGAAPISADIIQYFSGLDIVIREVYGQSEDTGPTSFNLPGRTKYGSVGPALPGVEVKIAGDDEILVKGPNVFLGYYKEPDATAETLVDGYLHSGDLGRFDSDGYLHITGRKKDIIITAGGKNIAPKNWEGDVKNHALVGEAVMIGDKQKYLVGLISLDPDAAADWAKKNGADAADLVGDARLRASLQAWIDDANSKYARVEQVKKFVILPRALSIEEGELTPTLKVKRSKVHAHFAEQIAGLYGDDYVAS